MRSSTKKLLQKSIAVVVIVAILKVVGVSALMMVFATGVVFFVWVVNHRSQTRDLEHIFDFYVAAEAILREDERRWYAFEVAEVIEDGEQVFDYLPHCPTLHLFALGALYHRIGKHEATIEYLGRAIEDQLYDEQQNIAPSEQLRRYVTMLRHLESNPTIAPQKLAAVRGLERMRRRHADRLLQESRSLLKTDSVSPIDAPSQNAQAIAPDASTGYRPPISEVLHDVYEDDKSPLN